MLSSVTTQWTARTKKKGKCPKGSPEDGTSILALPSAGKTTEPHVEVTCWSNSLSDTTLVHLQWIPGHSFVSLVL